MMAASYGSPEAVKLLVEAGADIAMRNQKQMTAMDFARRAERRDAVELLTQAERYKAQSRPPAERGRWWVGSRGLSISRWPHRVVGGRRCQAASLGLAVGPERGSHELACRPQSFQRWCKSGAVFGTQQPSAQRRAVDEVAIWLRPDTDDFMPLGGCQSIDRVQQQPRTSQPWPADRQTRAANAQTPEDEVQVVVCWRQRASSQRKSP